jgi:hypothetical protein
MPSVQDDVPSSNDLQAPIPGRKIQHLLLPTSRPVVAVASRRGLRREPIEEDKETAAARIIIPA